MIITFLTFIRNVNDVNDATRVVFIKHDDSLSVYSPAERFQRMFFSFEIA